MVGATSVRTRARARSSLGVSTAGMRHSPRAAAAAAVTVLSVPYNQIHPLGFLKPSGRRSPKSTKTRRVGEVRHPSQIRFHARRRMEMVFVAATAAVASCAAAGKTPAPLRQSVSRSVGSSSGARCPRRRLTSLPLSLYLAAATKGMLT